MSTPASFKALLLLAVTTGLFGCSPSDKPTSLFWDVPPPSASTDTVLVASATYIGDLFAEAEQQLKNHVDPSEPTASF